MRVAFEGANSIACGFSMRLNDLNAIVFVQYRATSNAVSECGPTHICPDEQRNAGTDAVR